MNNKMDAQQLYLQQLLAAQSQRGMNPPYVYLQDPQLQQLHALQSTVPRYDVSTGTMDPQQLQLLQRVMVMNNERNLHNERILSQGLMSSQPQFLQQERLLQQQHAIAHDRGLKRSHQELMPEAPSTYPETPEAKVPGIPEAPLAMEQPKQSQGLPSKLPANRKQSSKTQKKKQDTKWLASYEELKIYKAEHGDCIVPRGYPLNPRLASWVAEQRKQYKLMKDGKQSSITARRIELLNEIDFAWNAQEAAWDRHMSDLQRFRDEFGDCLVPLNHPKYPKLGLWVKEQRRHYTLMKQGKPSHMTEERARALDEVGFCWDTHEAVWGERLRELCEYKATHGDCIVPTNYSSNPKLGTWVHHQRRQYKKYKEGKPCHITAERIRALESLGFVWYPRERSRTTTTFSGSDTESDTDLGNLDLRPNKRQRA